MWHIILQCTTDNLGEKGTNTLLRRAGLEEYIGMTPEDDDTPSISLDELSNYNEALFYIFGENGARPVLLRAGKLGFKCGQSRLPEILKLAGKILNLLPEKERLTQVVTRFIEKYGELMNTHGSVFKEGDKIIVEIPDSAYCKKLSTERPACYVEVGLLSALVHTTAGDGYTVAETTCIARGDSVCRFEIERVEA